MNTRLVVLVFVLIVLSVFTTAFAMINYANSVMVWPLMSFHPLTLVIAVSFVLGAAVGGLVVSLFQHKRVQMSYSTESEGKSTSKHVAAK